MTNTSTDIASLADRLEAASGADRELDAEIALTLGIVRERDGDTFYGHKDYSCLVLERGYYDHGGNAPELPHYTASIDAALSLVPAPMRFMLERRAGGENYRADVWCAGSVPYGSARSWAATPALALCAAAVRSILRGVPG